MTTGTVLTPFTLVSKLAHMGENKSEVVNMLSFEIKHRSPTVKEQKQDRRLEVEKGEKLSL